MLLWQKVARAQILDDSTKQVYGPQTTRYFLEEDLFNGLDTLYTLDTSIVHFDRYDYTERGEIVYQDLGNLGTPLNPLFFQLPAQPGVQFGLETFTPFFYDPRRTRYYNTRSPYSYLDYVQGGTGQQILRAGLSWNVTPQLNFGFEYQRISSDKQIGVSQPRDREADHFATQFYGSYQSQDKRYAVLLNYSYLNHRLDETGGILPGEGESTNDLFDYALEDVRLPPGVRTRDMRNRWYLYQQYKLLGQGGIQLYHRAERLVRRQSYNDPTPPPSEGAFDFYANRFGFTPTTNHIERYQLWENTVGLKGRIEGFQYGLFFLRRDFRREAPFINLTPWTGESYGGATLQYFLNDSSAISGYLQYSLNADYELRARVRHRWLRGEQRRLRYSPTLWQQAYVGNHFAWINDFAATVADRTFVQAIFPFRKFRLAPYGELLTLQNHIFWNEQAQPQQANEVVGSVAFGLEASVQLAPFFLELEARQTSTFGPDVLRMPPLWGRSRLYYMSNLFDSALRLQTGVEFKYRGAYFGDRYMPVLNQFHLQNDFLLAEYGWADIYANLGIRRATIFLKMTQINQGLGQDGYFVTPIYPGLRRVFIFGVKWQFFD